jgi:ABC-type glutathione transport system ATPase component
MLRSLQAERGLTLVFITHNLALVRSIAQRVAVMHDGGLVEMGDTQQVLDKTPSSIPAPAPGRPAAPDLCHRRIHARHNRQEFPMTQLTGRPLEIVTSGQNHAHVAIPTADGGVQTVIVWAHADDNGNLTLNSVEGRVWPKNLRQAGTATVTLMADGNPLEYVSIRGRLVGDSHEGAEAHIDQLSAKYLGEHPFPYREPGEQRVMFTLEPVRVTYQPEE